MKLARLKMGLTQKEVATLIGLHPDTIYLLENDKSKVRDNYIFLIKSILSI